MLLTGQHRGSYHGKGDTELKARLFLMTLAAGLLGVVAVSLAEDKAAGDGKEAKAAEVKAEEEKADPFTNDVDRVSYAIGVQIGTGMKQQGLEVNPDMIAQAMKDVFAGKETLLNQEQVQKVFMDFQKQMMEKQKKAAEENAKKGAAFLEANKGKEGVKVLPSGLQYKVITEGTGKTPTADDRVKTNYRGTLIDGTEFDSSYKRGEPAEFPVKGVIRGWTEALQLMKEGAKWELYIPAALGYGERGSQSIPGNSTLVFEIELLEVLPKAEPKEMPKLEIK